MMIGRTKVITNVTDCINMNNANAIQNLNPDVNVILEQSKLEELNAFCNTCTQFTHLIQTF